MMFKAILWSMQGFNGIEKQREVRNLIRQERPTVCMSMEMKIKAENEDDIMKKNFVGWRCINNYDHYNGRICFLYKDEELKVNVCQKASQMITCMVEHKSMNKEFIISATNAKNYAIGR